MQSASKIVMVRPASFGFNEQTAANNHFQKNFSQNFLSIEQHALNEFDAMVALLRDTGMEVFVLEDTILPQKPDAVFPNNWFCCRNQVLDIFPLFAPNRRLEKRPELVKQIMQIGNVLEIIDHSSFESENKFLESTGSMIFDHLHNSVYACISERTDTLLFERFAAQKDHNAISFFARDEKGREIYHTNVMMSIATDFAVVCSASITDHQRDFVVANLASTGRTIIDISFEQMKNFAGNGLELRNKNGELFFLMSKSAHDIFEDSQLDIIRQHCSLIVPDVSTIETTGGGSVRCMVAEIFD